MTQYLRAFAETNAADDGPIRFIASNEGDPGDGFDLKAEDWDFGRFLRNPVILWGHDFMGSRLPIGKALSVGIENRAMITSVQFDLDDPFAREVDRKFRAGYLSGVSVSWDTIAGRNHLLEISAVPVPMDPGALMERQIRGMADMGQQLSKLTQLIDTETQQTSTHDAEALWAGTALQMVRLFLPDTDDAESVRLAAYKKLCRLYERQGKTAPEFLGTAELQALEPDVWRGLFLCGEADAVPELFVERAVVAGESDWLAAFHAEFTGAPK